MFHPGEHVTLRFTGDPETAELTFLGQTLTVANGRLEIKRKGALLAKVRVPMDPGKYAYEFRDGDGNEDTGHLRVVASPRTDPPAVLADEPDRDRSVRPRRLGEN